MSGRGRQQNNRRGNAQRVNKIKGSVNTISSGTSGNKRENNHLPNYIKTLPWYYKGAGSEDYLVHHRQDHSKKNTLDIDHNDEPKIGLGISDAFVTQRLDLGGGKPDYETARGQRCSNCGAFGHVKRDCLEKPSNNRARVGGLQPSSRDIRIRDDNELDWDAKQDRWFGYTGTEYEQALERWENEKKGRSREEKAIGRLREDNSLGEESTEGYDTDEEIEMIKLGFKSMDKRIGIGSSEDKLSSTSPGITSVRLREDKAMYLNDIGSTEIRYDPKSRLYKSEELGSIDGKSKMFHRHLTGEGRELEELNRFARMESRRAGIRDEVENKEKIKHVLIANPTKYEKLMKEQQQQQQENTGQESSDKLVDLTERWKDSEAAKVTGTKQTESSRKTLDELYR